MISYSPLLCLDFYKTAHAEQYPATLTKMVSYYTPRMTRLADTEKVTMFGLQAFIQEYLIEAFNTHFFDRSLDEVLAEYKRVLNNTIGTDGVGVERLTALHKLGYLPLEIRAVPEGTRTNIHVPQIEISNTNPNFVWLVNSIETMLSCTMWHTKDEIVQWIRSYFESNGPGCDAVVGISGGKDSSVVAALCVEALGKERVVGVMMPNGEQPDLDDSKQLIEFLGIRYAYTDISKAVSAVSDQVALNMNVSDQTRINLPPRIRMATLYAISQSLPHGGRVANTCNRSEDYVGYSTKFGDSAGDFSPLANLMVHEVIQIGYELLLPINLISKIPSDGLCGKTDEDNLGFTYAHLDAYIMYGTSGIEEIDKKIASMHDHNLHKLNPMPAYGTTIF